MDDGGGERAMMGYSMSTCSRQVVRTTALRSRKRETERGRKREFLVLYSVLISNLEDTYAETPEKTQRRENLSRHRKTPKNSKSCQPFPSRSTWKNKQVQNLVKLIATHAIEPQEHPIGIRQAHAHHIFPFPFFTSHNQSAGSIETSHTPPRSNTPKHPHNQKPTSTNKPNPTENRNTVQHNTHVNSSALLLGLISRLVRAAANINAIDASSIEDDGREREVAEHPGEDDGGAEALVVVLVLLLRGDVALRGLPFGLEGAELGLVLGVEVCVVGGDGDVDFAAGFDIGCGEFLGFVVALCAPGDVVGVAEGVDVEDVDVCWR
jgi:hypothetical protein